MANKEESVAPVNPTGPDFEFYLLEPEYKTVFQDMPYGNGNSKGLGIQLADNFPMVNVLANSHGDCAKFNELGNRYGKKLYGLIMKEMRRLKENGAATNGKKINRVGEVESFNTVLKQETVDLCQHGGFTVEKMTDR